jgi:RHS repeat-associated protein
MRIKRQNIFEELVSTTYSDDTPTISNFYNRVGQKTVAMRLTNGIPVYSTHYTYSNNFALVSEESVLETNTNTLSYSYDSQGQQTAYSFSSVASGVDRRNLAVTQVTDSYGRIATQQAIFGSETNTFHFNYLYGSAMVSSITNNLGFGISKYYEDNRNLIVGVSNYFGSSPISAFIYENDALGRRTERFDFDENLFAKTNTFSYNQHQELNEANMGTNEYSYIYDNLGNRYTNFINGTSIRYDDEGENLNQYIEIYCDDRAYDRSLRYDLDGNMTELKTWTSPSVTWQYTWNGENRMTSAHNTQDGTYITYSYDYQGRMFEKVTNGSTNHFIWNGNHIVAEMTDSTTNYYCWSNGETLTASLNGETVFYCHDANKNVTDLVDDSGTQLVHYDYSPFGVQSSTVYSSPAIVSLNPFRFSNEYFDSITGQVEYEQRKYLPALGKFLSRDPIGIQGGLNETAICGNDLINKIDLWGLVGVVAFAETKKQFSGEFAEENCTKCCKLYILFQYKPDPGEDAPVINGATIADNDDLKQRWKKDINIVKAKNKKGMVISATIDNIGAGGNRLFAYLEKVRKVKSCKDGISVIMYGHGNENGNGIIYPLTLTEAEREKYAGFGSELPDENDSGVVAGSIFLADPAHNVSAAIKTAKKWNDIWKNVKTVHAKACFSAGSANDFRNMYFTGYVGLYEFGSGVGDDKENNPPSGP